MNCKMTIKRKLDRYIGWINSFQDYPYEHRINNFEYNRLVNNADKLTQEIKQYEKISTNFITGSTS